MKKKKIKKQSSLKLDEQPVLKKKKGHKKTYFRIKSAGNARTTDKNQYKQKPNQRGFVQRTVNQYTKK